PVLFTLFPYTTLFRSDVIVFIYCRANKEICVICDNLCVKVVLSVVFVTLFLEKRLLHPSISHNFGFKKIFFKKVGDRKDFYFFVDRKSTRLNSSHVKI